jgi:N-acetylglucosaminyl-diphospho-decaprenol L-rhamnosyltransferase
VTELAVIIVNRNGRDYLGPCLDSVRRASAGRDWETLVVDNASEDGSPEAVAREHPEAKLVRSGANVGFGRANNAAWRRTRTPFVLFLNPDTRIVDGAVDVLLRTMEEKEGAGACGPLLVREDGSFQVSFGGRVGFFRELVQKTALNAWSRRRLGRLPRLREADWVSGACLLVRREVLERLAGFDEDFFLYFEDIDLCLRMREAGWKVLFVPQARVVHLGGGATAAFGPSRYEYRRSQIRFYEKHCSALSRALLKAYLRSSFALLGLRRRLKREGRPEGPSLAALLKKGGPGT